MILAVTQTDLFFRNDRESTDEQAQRLINRYKDIGGFEDERNVPLVRSAYLKFERILDPQIESLQDASGFWTWRSKALRVLRIDLPDQDKSAILFNKLAPALQAQMLDSVDNLGDISQKFPVSTFCALIQETIGAPKIKEEAREMFQTFKQEDKESELAATDRILEISKKAGYRLEAVSYTHLTLPTIYSV